MEIKAKVLILIAASVIAGMALVSLIFWVSVVLTLALGLQVTF